MSQIFLAFSFLLLTFSSIATYSLYSLYLSHLSLSLCLSVCTDPVSFTLEQKVVLNLGRQPQKQAMEMGQWLNTFATAERERMR